jgi:hypothetical protein
VKKSIETLTNIERDPLYDSTIVLN